MKVSRFSVVILMVVTIMVTVVVAFVFPSPVAEVVSTSPFQPIEVSRGESQKKAHILVVPSSTRDNKSFEFRLTVSSDLVRKPDKWKEMLVGINQPSPTFQTSVGYNAPDGVWFTFKTNTPLVSGVYPISLQLDPETSDVSEWKVVVWVL